MTKPKIKKILVYGVLAVAATGAGTYIFLIQREKAQFNQAEKEIDALYSQITDKVGKPDQEKKEKSCGYASRVYGKGPRSCSVSRSLLYSNNSLDKANVKLNTLSSLVGGELRDDMVRDDRTQFEKYIDSKPDQNFSQTLETKTVLNCSVQYQYPVLPSIFKEFGELQGENFALYLSCGGPAMAEHYPLRD